MGTRTVHYSDLSGEVADQAELGRLVVLEYPGISGPVTLEVRPDEVAKLEGADRFVRVAYYQPGERQPRLLTLPVEQFDALAPDRDMEGLLRRVLSESAGERGRPAPPPSTPPPPPYSVPPPEPPDPAAPPPPYVSYGPDT